MPKAATKPRLPRLTEDHFHTISRALADPRRFAILQQIAAVPTITCSALNEHHIITPATISHHLKELTEAGLITSEREGRLAHLTLQRPVFDAYLARLAKL